MRLFIAVPPPSDVIDAIDALPRPSIEGVRWTTRDQWHVTLRFLGELHDPDALIEAVRAADLVECTASVGPRAGMLSRVVVQLPVAGLDGLARAVVETTAAFGDPPPERPFRGHLTLARTKGRRVPTDALVLEHTWPVREIELVRSHLGRGGARYEALERFALRRI